MEVADHDVGAGRGHGVAEVAAAVEADHEAEAGRAGGLDAEGRVLHST